MKIFAHSVLFSLFFTVFPAQAQVNCPPPVQAPTSAQIKAAQQQASDRGFLWRASKDGRTSYLYGTIHIAKFEWMFPGTQVTQALRNTDTYALELDAMDTELTSRSVNAMQKMRKTVLPDALNQRIRKLSESICVPYESVATLMPELQVATLIMLMGRTEGYMPEYAIDAVIAAVGHGGKRKVISLETPESQLALLQMKTPEETIAMVQEELALLDKENGHTYIEQVARIWGSSDYAAMDNFESWCQCMDTEIERKVMKSMLDDRNPAMAERIDELHKNGGKVFAAVGSLHMFGPLGLPSLLEKRGYKVERIELQPR